MFSFCHYFTGIFDFRGYHILAISHQSHKVSFTHYVISWSHIFILAIISLLVYYVVISLASRHKPEIGSVLDSERFTQLVDRYPTDSEASLAYLGDKLLYWYQVQEEDRIVFQFSIKNNKCIVMSDPIGDLTYVREAIADFIRHAKRQNMTLIFYEVSHETTILLHDFGYEFMKFGESARLDLRTFSLEGKQHKKYRSAINKIEAKGYYFQVLKAPHSQELLEDLRAVSTSWLNGRKEKGFSLGFFKVDYLQLAPLAVVKDSSGQIVAFVNFLPTNNNKVASIDLMRYHLELAPNGIMDYLFVNLFLYFKEAGVDYFDLGMAPLSNVGNMEDSFLQEKLAYLIYSLSSRFYSFAGLRQYKQKFNPIWQSKYIAYPRQNWLIYDMIAIFLIDNQAKSS
ncbi:phosphatidylglycerol lysyltransferase domain-containing protein [Streptococcus didelphis]|uniref:Phosphatidylglycerol lysyltransferase domain-containing protein n=1 Tax=Streptococcus didelphis TaxID=102886 RepID=A0ABY9LH49_9STRE|nr:phosphatidylglycerol lysyltransferase domain-containing protein [Streptococcus didelphis]WMB28184.1 phosphatidylglycerol lysyltransferase domain-containing protein [Streptococcus didelphis]